MKRFLGKGHRRAGFTVLEMAIGVVMLLILSGAVLQTLQSMKRMALVGDVQGRGQREAERALDQIVQDLRRSGFVSLEDRAYPHFVLEGQPDAGFDEEDGVHFHAPATKAAVEGDPDFGPDIGLLLVLPALWPQEVLGEDLAQAQRWPYGRPVVVTDTNVWGPGEAVDSDDEAFAVEENGSLVWRIGNPISYSLRTDTTGRNTLVRRDSDGAFRVLARDVERLVFERNVALITPEIPLGAVRVRIFFRVPDYTGRDHRFQVEATVRLRNGTGV